MNVAQSTLVTLAAKLATCEDGGTFNAASGLELSLTEGFVVGGVVPTLTISTDLSHNVKVYRIGRWLYDNAHHTFMVGAWVNDGTLYIDAVNIILDRDNAIALGTSRKEIAIWDAENGCEITL